MPNNYYPAENWYQVKVVLNTYTNRYDLYIDGARRCRNLSLARGLYPKENVFNVKAFGAVGDGTTDDTQAIAAAIQAAEYTGGTVLLENGS